jgi:hypothetical protein
MLCLIAEITMTIFGIITLAKGKFSFTRNRIVKGIPAYVIGIILIATFPVILSAGFITGVVMTILAHGRQPDMQHLKTIGVFLELGSVLVISLIVFAIACISSRKIE